MRVTFGVALCLLGGPARADVVVQPGVLFSAAELVAAIRARGGPEQSRLDVEVSSPEPGRLALVMPAGRWEIEIGAAGSDTAARVVALHVIELWAGTAATAVPAAVAAQEGANLVKASAVSSGDAELQSAAVQEPRPRYRVAALGVGSLGSRSGDFGLVGGAIEVARSGRWVAGGGIGWQRGLRIDRTPGAPIAADLVRVHAVGGIALGAAELVAGGFVGRAVVDGGNGTISRWNTGLEAAVRVAVPVSDGWALVVAAGGEVFRERIEVRFGNTRIGATPRAALCSGIGFAWMGERPR